MALTPEVQALEQELKDKLLLFGHEGSTYEDQELIPCGAIQVIIDQLNQAADRPAQV
jgi:hypothetical protein